MMVFSLTRTAEVCPERTTRGFGFAGHASLPLHEIVRRAPARGRKRLDLPIAHMGYAIERAAGNCGCERDQSLCARREHEAAPTIGHAQGQHAIFADPRKRLAEGGQVVATAGKGSHRCAGELRSGGRHECQHNSTESHSLQCSPSCESLPAGNMPSPVNQSRTPNRIEALRSGGLACAAAQA